MSTSQASPQARKPLRLIIAAALVLAVAATGAWLWFGSAQTMPDTVFITTKGERIQSRDLKGQVVLVNFWATSCVTCVKEMPMLVDTYRKYADQGYRTIAVAMRYDPPNFVLNFVESRQLPFTVALDVNGHNAQVFGDVKLTPTTLLIDRRGRIVKRYLGEPPVEQLHAEIERALRES